MASGARVGETASVAVRHLGGRTRRPPGRGRVRPTSSPWIEPRTPVDIVAPDLERARALLGEAAPHFRAELAEAGGSAVVVKLRPVQPETGGWVFELLALVERWLEASRLSAANAYYGGRRYLIPAAAHDREWLEADDPLSAA